MSASRSSYLKMTPSRAALRKTIGRNGSLNKELMFKTYYKQHMETMPKGRNSALSSFSLTQSLNSSMRSDKSGQTSIYSTQQTSSRVYKPRKSSMTPQPDAGDSIQLVSCSIPAAGKTEKKEKTNVVRESMHKMNTKVFSSQIQNLPGPKTAAPAAQEYMRQSMKGCVSYSKRSSS